MGCKVTKAQNNKQPLRHRRFKIKSPKLNLLDPFNPEIKKTIEDNLLKVEQNSKIQKVHQTLTSNNAILENIPEEEDESSFDFSSSQQFQKSSSTSFDSKSCLNHKYYSHPTTQPNLTPSSNGNKYIKQYLDIKSQRPLNKQFSVCSQTQDRDNEDLQNIYYFSQSNSNCNNKNRKKKSIKKSANHIVSQNMNQYNLAMQFVKGHNNQVIEVADKLSSNQTMCSITSSKSVFGSNQGLLQNSNSNFNYQGKQNNLKYSQETDQYQENTLPDDINRERMCIDCNSSEEPACNSDENQDMGFQNFRVIHKYQDNTYETEEYSQQNSKLKIKTFTPKLGPASPQFHGYHVRRFSSQQNLNSSSGDEFILTSNDPDLILEDSRKKEYRI